MIALAPHKKWISLLAVALVLGICNNMFVDEAVTESERTLASLRTKNHASFRAMEQLKEDIASAETLKTVLDDQAAQKFLAPIDRVRTGEILERRAEEARLTHFSYSLSPEEKTSFDTEASQKLALGLCTITLEADAPTDLDVYIFLDSVDRMLSGSLALKRLSLQRITPYASPMTAANLHFKVIGKWLSNGTSTIAGATQ